MNTQKMVKQLIEWKDAYYNGQALVDDEVFDSLEDKLKAIDPDNDYFKIVGAPIRGDKVKHLYPMLSQNKAKTIEDVEDWLKKILDKETILVVESKIDGLSIGIVYEKGVIKYIATRGDGVEGRIITHIADYIDIPKTIESKERIEVRGELVIYKDAKIPNPENKPLRNIASGLVNRKDSGLEDLKYLNFVAYQLLGTDIRFESSKLLQLEKIGFNVVKFYDCNSIKQIQECYKDYVKINRNKWPYMTDGLVIIVNDNSLHEEINSKYVVSHHNHYSIALKPIAEGKKTELLGITWNVSKSGNVIPVAKVKPIEIGGSIIQNVTLNNFKNVMKLKLHEGDEVIIEKANEVIPFFKQNLIHHVATDNELIPNFCTSCSNVLIEKGVHLYCDNPQCPEKIIQLITSWCVECKMDQIAEATIRALWDASEIRCIRDLYLLKENNLQSIPGIGKKKIKNLLEQIEKSKNMTIVEFIARLSIEHVGEKGVVKLGIKTIDDFWNFNDDTRVIGKNIIEYRNSNKKSIEDLMKVLNVTNIETRSEKMSKGVVCMTGKGMLTRNELIKLIEEKGYEFVDSVTKNTNILICEDVNGTSSKLIKAKKNGIKLVSYEEFFK
jgi:DNA ligase (NAD+)